MYDEGGVTDALKVGGIILVIALFIGIINLILDHHKEKLRILIKNTQYNLIILSKKRKVNYMSSDYSKEVSLNNNETYWIPPNRLMFGRSSNSIVRLYGDDF